VRDTHDDFQAARGAAAVEKHRVLVDETLKLHNDYLTAKKQPEIFERQMAEDLKLHIEAHNEQLESERAKLLNEAKDIELERDSKLYQSNQALWYAARHFPGDGREQQLKIQAQPLSNINVYKNELQEPLPPDDDNDDWKKWHATDEGPADPWKGPPQGDTKGSVMGSARKKINALNNPLPAAPQAPQTLFSQPVVLPKSAPKPRKPVPILTKNGHVKNAAKLKQKSTLSPDQIQKAVNLLTDDTAEALAYRRNMQIDINKEHENDPESAMQVMRSKDTNKISQMEQTNLGAYQLTQANNQDLAEKQKVQQEIAKNTVPGEDKPNLYDLTNLKNALG